MYPALLSQTNAPAQPGSISTSKSTFNYESMYCLSWQHLLWFGDLFIGQDQLDVINVVRNIQQQKVGEGFCTPIKNCNLFTHFLKS
jgi:hypothetical protein